MTYRHKSAKWKRKRVEMILARDGPACWLCGLDLKARRGCISTKAQTTLEHLTPQCLGGSDELDNLVLCHAPCNRHLKNHPHAKKLEIQKKWRLETERVLARRTEAKRRRQSKQTSTHRLLAGSACCHPRGGTMPTCTRTGARTRFFS